MKSMDVHITRLLLLSIISFWSLSSVTRAQNTDSASRVISVKYSNLRDSELKSEKASGIEDIETRYQTEKKELRIAAMEKERKMGITLTIVGAALGLAIIGLSLFKQRITKNKEIIAQQRILQLEKEKQLVATQAILDGETAERARLARDLHDGLGGMLSAIKLNLHEVKRGIHLEGEDAIRFNQALEMLETSAKELRQVAHNMMPEALTRFGLKTSLQDFIRNVPNAYFHYFGDDVRIDPKLEVMIYRTAYELVNNAIKHAEAEDIHVQLVQQPDSVSLTVHDDGKGFNPDEIGEGNGLANIKRRVQSFNGTINIFSCASEGTEVNVEFKITAAA